MYSEKPLTESDMDSPTMVKKRAIADTWLDNLVEKLTPLLVAVGGKSSPVADSHVAHVYEASDGFKGTWLQVKAHEQEHKLADPHGHAAPPPTPLVGGEILNATKPGEVVLEPVVLLIKAWC